MEPIRIILGILFLPSILCSLDDLNTQLRVVGGIKAEPHSAPFMASLFARNRRGLLPYCAGSIINENWVLTAAHCLQMEAYRIHIAAGHHNIHQFEETVQRRRADFTIQHEDFDKIGPYDIGMIHVSRPFEFTPHVQPLSLSIDDDPAGVVTVFGWGSTSTTNERDFPNTLRTVNLTLVSNDYCESKFPVEIDEGNICAGLPEDEKGACVGDSGGPIIQNGTQIGIVSWGPKDCDPEEGPTVFTKITSYEDWIKDVIANGLRGSEEDDDDDDYDDDFVPNPDSPSSNVTNSNNNTVNVQNS